MDKIHRAMLSDGFDRMKLKIVEAAELIVDSVTERLAAPARDTPKRKQQITVARRQMADVLHTSAFCPNTTCRRSHCCRGEPLHCLQTVVPLLPPEAFAGLVKKKRRSTSRRLRSPDAAQHEGVRR